jgi:uncharacterized membrane protein YdjX (TVP38/TMEM64 family)
MRWFFLIIILLSMVAFLYSDFSDYLTYSFLKENRDWILDYAAKNYILTVGAFIIIYTIAVACSFPGASFLSLAGGFIFGIIPATVFVVISATLGAVMIFLVVKTTLGSLFSRKASGWVKEFEQGFQDDAFNYLLFIRLMPIFPFWVVNIVPALLDMKSKQFIVATFLGIIPGTAVYCSVGNGLGTYFKTDHDPELTILFTPEIMIPIILLALLSIAPVVYKKIKDR